MSAPVFCSVTLLATDLRTLGYPRSDDTSALQPDGDARIDLLTWLASQIDPTAELSSVDQVAIFWDNLGIHSGHPSPTGHRIPFTAPNRSQHRAATFVFLRSAIDLVLAIRRLRAPHDSPEWAQPDATSEPLTSRPHSVDSPTDAPLDPFDVQCLAQLDHLIRNRHALFPSTAHLFSDATCATKKVGGGRSTESACPSNPHSKRPPLAVKSASSANIPKPSASMRSPSSSWKAKGKPTPRKAKQTSAGPSIPAREHVIERLRALRRELADFVTTAAKPETESSIDEDLATLDMDVARTLATSAKSVSSLVSRVDAIADNARAVRAIRIHSANRDHEMESQMAVAAPICFRLLSTLTATISAVARIRNAVESLRRSSTVLKSLPSSPPIQSVIQQRLRTERQLGLHM